jgi:hypothetical protein
LVRQRYEGWSHTFFVTCLLRDANVEQCRILTHEHFGSRACWTSTLFGRYSCSCELCFLADLRRALNK